MPRPKPATPTSMSSFRLPVDALAQLNEMATSLHTSKTQVLDAAIRAQYRRYTKALIRAQQEQQP